MKKIIIFLSIVIMFFTFFTQTAFAVEEFSADTLREEAESELFSSMSAEAKEALRKVGINDLSLSKLYSFSFKSFIAAFSSEGKVQEKKVFKSFFELFSVLLLGAAFSFAVKDDQNERMFNILFTCAVIVIGVKNIDPFLNLSLSALKISSGFIFSFVPILTLMVSISGNPVSALNYNTFVLSFCEIISALINSFLTDFMGCFFCLGISFSLSKDVKGEKLISFFSKSVNLILGLSSALFSGILKLKTSLSLSSDSLSKRGIKFLISGLVPVIGSSISESFSAILSSLSLVKTSVALVGIIAVTAINIPVLIEGILFYFSFSVLSYFSELLSFKELSVFFKVIYIGIKTMLLMNLFLMFILIISSGLMVSLKGVM